MTVDPVSASILIMAGICTCAAINHGVNAFRDGYSALHLLFSITCLGFVAYELLHLLTYTANSLGDYVERLKWELFFILLAFSTFPWFVARYTEVTPRPLLVGFNVVILVLMVWNLSSPFSIQFASIDRLQELRLPGGSTITQPVGTPSIGYFLGVVTVLLIFLFAFFALLVKYRRERSRSSLIMLFSLVLYFLTAVEGILVRAGVINFIHLGPYGLLAMIIAMSITLGHEQQQKLLHARQRFRSLMDLSDFGIQVVSPRGQTLQVNSAWKNLLGVGDENISNYDPAKDSRFRDVEIAKYLRQSFSGEPVMIPPFQLPMTEDSGKRRWVRVFLYPVRRVDGIATEVILLFEDVTAEKRQDEALRILATGVSTVTGRLFYERLVLLLAKLFDASHVFIGVLDAKEADYIETLAVCDHGNIVPNFQYALKGTPCANVVGHHTCVYSSTVQQHFPDDELLRDMEVESYVGSPMYDPDGNPLGIIVLMHEHPLDQQDVGQLQAIMEIFAVRVAAEIERDKVDNLLKRQTQHLKSQVESRTRELTDALQELESFSYSVSHDLRAPLRAIEGFSQMLEEDCSAALPDECRGYLGRIRKNTYRMDALIRDLLQLSRISRKPLERRSVNLTKLAKASLERLRESAGNRKVHCTVESGMVVSGDQRLLAIVMDNLLGNAWKYTSKTPEAEIEIRMEKQGDEVICHVKDNGVGFDMAYKDKIFSAFQRLHNKDEFEGTGIGLATVARIIRRHGGRVWAESAAGKGASFYFSLPAEE